MSILIKGMEMPENCFECPLRQNYIDGILCRAVGGWNDYNAGKPTWCPLVEVQEDDMR